MKNKIIIFTGSSSFSGYYFVKRLNQLGYKVHLFFSFKKENIKYLNNLKSYRVKKIIKSNYVYFNCKFGSKFFLNKLGRFKKIDYFCHHHHYTKDYNKNNYKLLKSLKVSLDKYENVLKILKEKKIKKFFYTGSYFEGNDINKLPFSEYGLSKKIVKDILSFSCKKLDIKFSSFIIPNVFGFLEDNKLYTQMITKFMRRENFTINNPKYKRDFVHINILSKDYVKSLFSNLHKKEYSFSYARMSNNQFCKYILKLFNVFNKTDLPLLNKLEKPYLEPLKRYNKELKNNGIEMMEKDILNDFFNFEKLNIFK